jgi:hypothetical protein
LLTAGSENEFVSRSSTSWRQAGSRLRADVPHAHHAVEEVVLHRHRDVLLDLLAREARRLGLDLEHRSLRQLRQNVRVHLRQRDDAECDQCRRHPDEQHPEAQRGCDQTTHDRPKVEIAQVAELQCDIRPQTSEEL